MSKLRLYIVAAIIMLSGSAAVLAAYGSLYKNSQMSFDAGYGTMGSATYSNTCTFGQTAVPTGASSMESPSFSCAPGSIHFTVLGDTEPPVIINLSLKGEIESARPRIAFRLVDDKSGIDESSVRLILDGITMVDDSNVSGHFKELGFGRATLLYQPFQDLDRGMHEVTVSCRDTALNATEPVTVEFEITEQFSMSRPRCYPNPVRSAPVTFRYRLTGDVEWVELRLYDASETLVTILEGSADPDINEIEWHLDDDFGDEVANGAYLARLVAVSSGGETIDRYVKVAVLR